MAIPAGTTIGEVAALWWISPARRARLLRPLAAAGFVPFLLFAFAPALLPSLGLLVLAGLGAAYIPGADALLLEETPDELRGRVFTLSTAGLMTTQGLGFAASGAVAEVLSVNATIVLAGLAGLTVVACIRPRRAPRPAPGRARRLGLRAAGYRARRAISAAAASRCSAATARCAGPNRNVGPLTVT